MVLSATVTKPAEEFTRVNGNGAGVGAPVQSAPRAPLTTCLKCGGQPLMKGYFDEPQCMICGWVDYHAVPDTTIRAKKSVVNSATRLVLRYVGDFSNLSSTLTQVQIVRLRNRAVYSVTCPFCTKTMERSSLSGKRPDVREERYKCIDGHKVSLIPKRNGALGWK